MTFQGCFKKNSKEANKEGSFNRSAYLFSLTFSLNFWGFDLMKITGLSCIQRAQKLQEGLFVRKLVKGILSLVIKAKAISCQLLTHLTFIYILQRQHISKGIIRVNQANKGEQKNNKIKIKDVSRKERYFLTLLHPKKIEIYNLKVLMLRTTLTRFRASGIKTPFPSTTHKPQPYNGPSFDQVVQDRKKWMPNFYFHYYKNPLLIVEGHLQYLYDHTGRRYIDCVSGISTVSCGHSHPNINKVIHEQTDKLVHTSSIYASEWQGEYSKRLCEELGDGFDSVYLCNSGSEANDFAIYLSRLYTNEYKFYSLRNAYHGLVGAPGNITNLGTWNSPMRGGFEFERLAWPSTYRGAKQTLEELIKDAEEQLNATAGKKIAGMIAEPIQGVGGINPLPTGYMPKMAELVRKYGGLVIADEVQTGFGRVGKVFWGHRWQGVKPDIVTMAKGIGNGFPMAAVVTRKEVTDKINQNFFNTFGGGHIQCRVGIEVLNVIRREKLDQNAEKVGNYLLTELSKLKQKHRNVGDVRGVGLMVGIEFVKDQESKTPGVAETGQLMELTRERGLLMGKAGAFGNVLRIQPPLCYSMEDAKYTVDAIDDALHQVK